MIWRALSLLVVVAAGSIALTLAFEEKIFLALGLILTQIKFLWGKLLSIDWGAIGHWLKLQSHTFARIELFKKWFYSTLVPLLMGASLRRRLSGLIERAKGAVRVRYDALWSWYKNLEWYERTIAGLILVFLSLALSVASLGLWLILFSVQLPLWILAILGALGRSLWTSVTKTLFKTLAFLQLTVLWRVIKRRLPATYLDRKRRLDFRMARAVVRRRKMTVRQLEAQHDSLSLRWALWRERWRGTQAEDFEDLDDAALRQSDP